MSNHYPFAYGSPYWLWTLKVIRNSLGVTHSSCTDAHTIQHYLGCWSRISRERVWLLSRSLSAIYARILCIHLNRVYEWELLSITRNLEKISMCWIACECEKRAQYITWILCDYLSDALWSVSEIMHGLHWTWCGSRLLLWLVAVRLINSPPMRELPAVSLNSMDNVSPNSSLNVLTQWACWLWTVCGWSLRTILDKYL